MSTMKNYIKDYVVENTKFFTEFDRSSFANTAVMALNRTGINMSISTKGNQYSAILEKTISHINEIEIDSYAISEFVSKILNSGRVESAKLVMGDISKANTIIMKPQYLNEAVLEYRDVINGIASGKYSKDNIRNSCANVTAYISTLKKRLVTSNIDVHLTPKDMIKYDDIAKVNVTTKYLEDTVIPFLQDVPKKKKDLAVEISAVNAVIVRVLSELNRLTEDVSTGINLNKVDDDKKKMMVQYTFNYVRAILESISYITYAAMRKVHQFEDAVIECQNVYNALTLTFNDSMTLIEAGTFDNKVITATDANNIAEKLVDGSNDAFAELAHNIMEYHKGYVATWSSDSTVSNAEEVTSALIEKSEYNRTVYNDIVKAYIEIGNGLDILAKNCDDYLIIFDQMVKKAGFVLELSDRFHNEINALDDLSQYGITDLNIGNNGEKSAIYHTILSEINDYADVTSQIAKAAKMVQTKAEYVEDLFNARKNGELAYSETMNELKIFLDSFKDQFRIMNCKIVKGLYMRLKMLAAKADSCLDNVNSTPEGDIYTPDDFFEEAVLSEVDYIEGYNDLVMEAMMREYYAEREFLERGVRLVYEAEGDASATAVKVTDNGAQASTDKPKGAFASALSNLVKGISEWFKKMIDAFNEAIGRTAKKNTEWLANNKEGLMTRSYSNVEIQILPYDQMPHTNVISDIGKLTTNIKAMSVENLKKINSYEELRSKIINTGIKFNKDAEEGATITNYYKVGNKPLQTTTYANNNIKTIIVENMIPYCENFYTTFNTEVNNQLKAVEQALEEVSKTYVTEAVEDLCNISIFTEAEAATTAPAEENTTNISTKAGWLKKCVQTYSGAVLNSIRDRNNDYFKVLYALAPKAKPATTPVQPATPENK